MCKQLDWELVLPDKLPNPEFYPGAIDEFYSKLESKSTRSTELKLNVKKHLLFLKWSIESKPQENCSDKFRYVSPDRKNTYYSLSSLCKAFKESQVVVGNEKIPFIPHDNTWDLDISNQDIEFSSLTSLLTAPLYDFLDLPMDIEQLGVQNPSTDSLLMESSDLSVCDYDYLNSPQQALKEKTLFQMSQDESLATSNLCIVPFAPPIQEMLKSTVCESDDGYKAVLEYHNLGPDAVRSQRGDDRIKYLRAKAKSQLECVGWVIKEIEKSGRKELRYVSPNKRKSYISLITACGCYLDNYKHYEFTPQKRLPQHQEQLTADNPRPMKKYRDAPLTLAHSTSENTCSSEKTPSVEGAPLTRRSGRNLLGRLIDDAEVAVGDEVYYRGKDGQPMAEGHITDEGLVKCKCCNAEMNLSSFETHSGSSNHRPAANIFLKKDERSLQVCQMLLKPIQDDKEIKTVVKEAKRANKKVVKEPSRAYMKVKKKVDAKCSICNKKGAIISCYKCPSKFHTDCVSFKAVPNGEWFCKSCEDEPCHEAESCEQSVVDYFTTGNILSQFSDENTKLRLKAKKHLRFIGWSILREEGTQRLEYKSPNGNVYFSLMAACQGCIFDES